MRNCRCAARDNGAPASAVTGNDNKDGFGNAHITPKFADVVVEKEKKVSLLTPMTVKPPPLICSARVSFSKEPTIKNKDNQNMRLSIKAMLMDQQWQGRGVVLDAFDSGTAKMPTSAPRNHDYGV